MKPRYLGKNLRSNKVFWVIKSLIASVLIGILQFNGLSVAHAWTGTIAKVNVLTGPIVNGEDIQETSDMHSPFQNH